MAAENLTHAKSMIRLFMGYIPIQVIYVAAKLGLAEHIGADGSSARELAQKLNVEAVLYVFDNPSRREHILLTDVEKDAKRERGNQASRELALPWLLSSIQSTRARELSKGPLRRTEDKMKMATQAGCAVDERLIHLLRHLGIAQAHFAGCMGRDVAELAASRPDVVSSLTLVCPWGLKIAALRPVSSRLLLVTGDQGQPAQEVNRTATGLPGAKVMNLPDYFSPLWADVIADRTRDVGATMMQFLSGIEPQPAMQVASLQTEGEIADLSYSVRGSGPPLVLLPLGLAPSQWEPLIALLSERYCTISVTGPALGMVAFLEARAQGYLRIVRSLVNEAGLRPGQSVLEVGCGSGVILRWLARYVSGANRMTGVDINPYLLREAKATVQKENLQDLIDLRECDGESLPFPDNHFDVTMTCTVMEEGNADRMLAECVRVTKSGGRVAAIVRALDMPWWVNLPLRAELKTKAEAQRGHVLREGCADASLYRRMRQAGLENLIMLPQWASFSAGERLEFEQERVLATLKPEEANEWREAVVERRATGPFSLPSRFTAQWEQSPR